MRRRHFLMSATAAALVPTVALAGPRAIVTSFDDPPWPGTRVVAINPETGLQWGCGMYVDSADNMLVRVVLAIESYGCKEMDEPLPPKLRKEDLPAAYRDQILERFRKIARNPAGFEPRVQKVFDQNPAYLTASPVIIVVRSSGEVLRKYDSQIPRHWERDDCSKPHWSRQPKP